MLACNWSMGVWSLVLWSIANQSETRIILILACFQQKSSICSCDGGAVNSSTAEGMFSTLHCID